MQKDQNALGTLKKYDDGSPRPKVTSPIQLNYHKSNQAPKLKILTKFKPNLF